MGLTDLHKLAAGEAARMIREGVVSSVELVEACLARAREVDADIQAWAFLARTIRERTHQRPKRLQRALA